jgi:GTP-binding protein EngB required for normal cell division
MKTEQTNPINCELQGIDEEHINNQLDELNQEFSKYVLWIIDKITDLEEEENYEKAAELMKEFELKEQWVAFQFHIWKGTPIEETKEVIQATFDYVYNSMKEFKKKITNNN